MHRIALSADVAKMIEAQRGTLHPYQRLDLRHTAHIIVDLQNGFMEPGAPVEVPVAREIVPNVNRISAAVRASGGKNFFLRMTVDAKSRASWSNWFAHLHTLERHDPDRGVHPRCALLAVVARARGGRRG